MNKRTLLEIVAIIVFVACMVVLSKLSYDQGYKKLEVELVYAIAGDRNQFVGNFHVLKDLKMNTIIGVSDHISVKEQANNKKKGEGK